MAFASVPRPLSEDDVDLPAFLLGYSYIFRLQYKDANDELCSSLFPSWREDFTAEMIPRGHIASKTYVKHERHSELPMEVRHACPLDPNMPYFTNDLGILGINAGHSGSLVYPLWFTDSWADAFSWASFGVLESGLVPGSGPPHTPMTTEGFADAMRAWRLSRLPEQDHRYRPAAKPKGILTRFKDWLF
jgi:hypothetical protein